MILKRAKAIATEYGFDLELRTTESRNQKRTSTHIYLTRGEVEHKFIPISLLPYMQASLLRYRLLQVLAPEQTGARA